MELLVATWTLRIALLGALVVGWLTVSAGGTPVDAVDRAALAAFAFTFLGRKLIVWLETPEQKMQRLRARRGKSAKAPKAPKAPKPAKETSTQPAAGSPADGAAASNKGAADATNTGRSSSPSARKRAA